MTAVTENVTLQLGDAELSVPKETLVLAWLQNMLADASRPASAAPLHRIGAEWLDEVGLYAGIMRGDAGAPDYHLFLLPGELVDAGWDKAVEWAESAGGTLPTRREQSLLFANLKEEFEPAWHWAGEQFAADPSYAWLQYFDLGLQGNGLKSYEGRARAVRRLIIQ
ncbi:hypothetical protein [Janthinobacterium fluminis]|uniref:DUF1566 domain-containing protein n=1 Tax=Janthinobacterium fluminis TaxID=2987524 RepID=A0ABT5JU44_9BURK|nr:hypothetical protein [Janthinobacterium fluminis]MDC8756228.1 hypothetical protein [Janthinobacterium fluminis]